MKKNIIFVLVSILVVVVLGIVLSIYNNYEPKVRELTDEEKQKLLQKISIEKEDILTNGNSIMVAADIKNDNSEMIFVKKIHVTLFDEYEKEIDNFDIDLNKKIKAKNKYRFSKTVNIKNNTGRTFTKYDIEL